MLLKLVLIFAAGGLGAVLRFGLGAWVQRLAGGLPAGTLFVNVVGCLAAGFLAAVLTQSESVREEHRLAILVGLLGAFTTFSTFSLETVRLWETGRHAAALAYVLVSNAGGLTAAWLGWRAAVAMELGPG
jgi:CrcB protein